MYRGLATALVGTIAVLAMLGTALGASLGETDLLNPNTSASQARSTDVQTQAEIDQTSLEVERHSTEIAAQEAADALNLEHQAALYEQEEKRGELELNHYAAILAEEQASLQRQRNLELQQQQQAFDRTAAWMEVQQPILLGVGLGAILVVTIAAAYYLYTCGQAKLMQAMQNRAGRQVPAGLVSGKPTTGAGWQATPSHQDQPGGNGRGPRVHSRSQG